RPSGFKGRSHLFSPRKTGTHSLRYFRLGVSDPGHGIPEFISVGYVDSPPITTYDSVSQLKEPRALWMAEHLTPTAGRGTLSCCGAGSTRCSCRGTTITQVMNAAAGFPPLVPTPR
uniref:MHC class I-like antigen recognition-like domain-containing protein n=1 Tax=Rhinolophus ferrumequinum TaxID=59479 RepID=A0A671FWJ7_RHIFE